MRKYRILSKIFIFVLCVSVVFGVTLCSANNNKDNMDLDNKSGNVYIDDADIYNGQSGTKEKFRGIWVSSVYNIDYPSVNCVGTDSEKLRKSALEILDDCDKMGFNAVI